MGISAAANGLGGDSPPSRIPVPARVYDAVVEDGGGTRVPVTKATFNGEIFVYGMVGSGQVTVAFDQISEVRFEPTNDPTKFVALAKLHDGQLVKLTVDSDVPCYGATSYGNYQIDVEDIRKITFTKPAPTAPEAPPAAP
jgi:hypothetical protein